MFHNPEHAVVDINSDVVEWQMHPRDLWLEESDCHLQTKQHTKQTMRIMNNTTTPSGRAAY